MINSPPEDWSDKQGWNRYFEAELSPGCIPSHAIYSDSIVLRFLSFAHKKGGRIWFPGCGLDPFPKAYAQRKCKVLATDFSTVAVAYQRRVAAAMLKEGGPATVQAAFSVAEHDFTQGAPDGEFDVVINCRAFQGLASDAMRVAAEHFFAALRPGGACILDTMNVQGSDRRALIEDSLTAAGFFVPFQKAERWYRQQLDRTGIVYWWVLGRPRIPVHHPYPTERFRKFAERDQKILDSFRAEYERRLQDEAAEVNAICSKPTSTVAHLVYATG